ncbi:Asp23/Gls24 family envelope stress response protein [Sinosporangium album]|nr:Asp23/Gls24 family envelope stress response protein [Sinosporangium album]
MPVRSERPPEIRGETIVRDRVVSRIAAHVARQVDGVGEVRERGRMQWSSGTVASVDRHVTAVHLDLLVRYPAPIRSVTENVRRHVADRVHELTGLTVAHVDIDVPGLVSTRSTRREEPS